MKLYTYHRSSAAFRVRIALNLKSIDAPLVPVSLLHREHQADGYKTINPQGLVPLLELDDTTWLNQSLAILEYLDEVFPAPQLLPSDPVARAKMRAFCQEIACDIHPLNNLRVLKYLQNTLEISDAQKQAWYHHWIDTGFQAIEQQLAQPKNGSAFCFGDAPSLADCLLIPQVYNGLRFDCDMSPYPNIMAVYDHCTTLPAFINAAPEAQADAPQSA